MPDWQTLSSTKRQQNAAKIPKEWRLPESILSLVKVEADLSVIDIPRNCGILTEKEIELTEKYDASDLLEKMASGQVSSYDVTLAFCKRAAIAQQLTNCLTEIFFDQALERAKEVDTYFANNKKPMGPLHGLPISLKDSFNVIGVTSTIGYVDFLKRPAATHNSAVVSLILRHGGVVYVKTNLPQTMMTADSENNVFGRTLNPNKLSLTAGGSTGGEGALVKIHGSPLGVGTDIAGSVRIPAYCNGIFGFKPTSGRIPFAGKTPPGRLGAPSSILPAIGPDAHSVRDLELFMKTIIDSEPWDLDENVLNIPWRIVEPYQRPLRLGLITEHPKRPLHPSVLRCMKSAAKALTEAGNSIVPLDGLIPDMWEAAILSWKYFLLDPKRTPVGIINEAGEPWVTSIATCSFEELKDYEPTLDQVFEMNMQRAKIVHVYHNLIVQNQLDGFIMPAYQATAVPHDTYGVPIYTVLPNLINYPAGSIPYLKAEAALDRDYIRENVVYEPPYVPEAVEGAPTGIQVVGRPLKDEECLKMMDVVAKVLGART